MAAWPDIEAPDGIAPAIVKKQLKSEFSAGYVQSRPLWTRSRRAWTLSWSAATEADLIALEDFFAANQGATFAWTHPSRQTVHTVRFADDEIKSRYVKDSVNRYSIDLTIEEQ